MMKIRNWRCLFLVVGFLTFPAFARAIAVNVSVQQTTEGYQFLRDGKPFYVKGAGADQRLDALAAAGANSVRTWGTDQTEVLIDEAHALGLGVCAGLWIEHERHGFDYNDEEAVAAEIARHCADVDRFKDHPGLLMWAVGNEVSIHASNPGVWKVIEAVAAHIKKVDPNHPVMTVLAHVSASDVEAIKEYCPSIDLLGFNSYGGIDSIGRDARKAGWDGPFLITEWGPDGGWEVDKTDWGAEIEPTSTQKAHQYGLRYARILEDSNCLGSYVFFWGQKQEVTQTWFNLFLDTGPALEGTEVLQYLWTGSFPAGEAPRISPMTMNGKTPESSIRVCPGAEMDANFYAWRADSDDVDISWELLRESRDKRQGGDKEERPESLPLELDAANPTHVHLTAPEEPGAYRLFVTVVNKDDRAAAANFPFYVENVVE